MLATIERIETKTNGQGSAYAVVHLDGGRRVYCWDARVAQALQPGGVFEVEVRDGRFPKLVRARPVASTNGTRETIVAQEGHQGLEATAAERLEALRLVLTLAQWTRLDSVDAALAAADKVLAWLKGTGGRPLRPPPLSLAALGDWGRLVFRTDVAWTVSGPHGMVVPGAKGWTMVGAKAGPDRGSGLRVRRSAS